MIIFPAIDLQDGKVVRLNQGKFDQVTEYSDNPIKIARDWAKQGAHWLHLVDLDGARTAEIKNMEIIIDIAKTVDIMVQVGGGIRNKKNIEQLLGGSVARVILSTSVIDDRFFLKEIIAQWKNKIAVSVDCSKGMVAQRGWQKSSNIKAIDLVKELEEAGVSCLIYTDISRDGMLTGPNFDELEELLAITKVPIIVSGGVSSIEDIKKCKSISDKGVAGVIIGKALYEGKLNLNEAIELCSQKE
jgi:phosphoribosylformimino-5-aminoimidazole carboxamide ribotide isomerase